MSVHNIDRRARKFSRNMKEGLMTHQASLYDEKAHSIFFTDEKEATDMCEHVETFIDTLVGEVDIDRDDDSTLTFEVRFTTSRPLPRYEQVALLRGYTVSSYVFNRE